MSGFGEIFPWITAIIGAIIGGYAGGPPGAVQGFAIGYSLGSFASQHLWSETTVMRGPRIADLRQQTADYGADKANVWGTMRISGNIIWASDLVEMRKIRHLDGDAEYWEYNYYGNFAIGLTDNEIIGIKKVFLDNKLYADFSSTIAVGAGSVSAIRSARFAVYPGNETQTADPTISSFVGAANTPAFRGTSYIVFNNLLLKNFGNRLPSVTIEVVANGSTEDTDWEFDAPLNNCWGVTMDDYGNLISIDSSGMVYIHSQISETVVASWDTGLSNVHGVAIWNGVLYICWQDATDTYITRYHGISASPAWTTSSLFGPYCGGMCIQHGKLYLVRRSIASTYNINRYDIKNAREGGDGLEYEDAVEGLGLFSSGNNCYGITFDADGNFYESHRAERKIRKRNGWNGAQLGVIDYPYGDGRPDGIYYDRNYDLLVVADDNYNVIMVLDGFSENKKQVTTITSSDANVKDIVEDICDDIDITSGIRDTSDLAGLTCSGYAKARQMSGRNALEPLMTAYNFDAVEIDHKLVFVKRGGASEVTIPQSDLAAHDPSEEMPVNLRTSRLETEEFPAELSLTYISANRDYQAATARSIRMITNSKRKVGIEYPLVLSHTNAKKAVEIAHNIIYTEKLRYQIAVSLEYLKYVPSNVITIIDKLMRIESMSIHNNLLQIEGPAELTSNYTSYAVTDEPGFPDQEIPIDGPTMAVFLDIPLLDETSLADDNPGFFIGVHGIQSGWVGAAIYISADGGQTFQEALSIMNESTVGFSTDALGDGLPGVWDLDNSVNVGLGKTSFSLSSSTKANVLNGSNWAAIGIHGSWEIIGFVDVVDEGDGTYTLSTLLRGLQGTEWATSGHAINDIFVVLDRDKLGRLSQAVEFAGVQQYYKAVSVHSDPLITPPITFTNEAVGKKCYSPVDIRGSRDGSNNLTITWKRRGRVDNEWKDAVDVALSEDSEDYEVDVYNNGSVVRTIERTVQNASYTAAQQTTDGLTPGDPVHVKIYQISVDFDRGYEGDATI